MMEHILEYVVNFHEVVIILCKGKEIIKRNTKDNKRSNKKKGVITLFFLAVQEEEKEGGAKAFDLLNEEKVTKFC